MNTEYLTFADRLLSTGAICDPWIDGEPRFRAEPVVVSGIELAEMYEAASAVARAHDEVARLVAREPALLDEFYGLSPWQKLMWLSEEPRWHGIARADVFRTADGGLAVCELNSDTPTGEPEAVILGELAAAEHGLVDPNTELGARFVAMVETMAARLLVPEARRAPGGLTIGLVYPTEMPEDLAVIQLYRRWLADRGHEVTLGSPFNVTAGDDGSARVMHLPVEVLLRHYKTDWWGERRPVWTDEPPCDDSQALGGPLAAVLSAVASGRAVAVNPFGAVVLQNKRTMALLWERIGDFSADAQATIRRYVPLTARLEAIPVERLAKERAYWVLKSDYGCEGEDVYIGNAMTSSDWEDCLARAIPERWVAQRYFATAENENGESINHGVFVVAGEAAGVYARVERGMTTVLARSAPLLVRS